MSALVLPANQDTCLVCQHDLLSVALLAFLVSRYPGDCLPSKSTDTGFHHAQPAGVSSGSENYLLNKHI